MRLAPTPRPQRLSRSSLIVLFYGALAAAAIVWAAYQGRPDIYRLTGRSTLPRLLLSPLLGVALGLAAVFLSRFAVHRFEWARVLHREFHSVVHEISSREIFLLALSSSIAEELFFRGALLPVVGLWISSALFAAMHVRPQLRFLPWSIMSFIVGLVFGALYLGLGDLGAPICAHFVINLLNLDYIAKTELAA